MRTDTNDLAARDSTFERLLVHMVILALQIRRSGSATSEQYGAPERHAVAVARCAALVRPAVDTPPVAASTTTGYRAGVLCGRKAQSPDTE